MKRLFSKRSALTLLALGLLSACALDAGEPFATVRPTFRAAFAHEHERETADGFWRLTSGFEVAVESAAIEVESIALLSSADSAASEAFDPAHPTEGYSNCHGGHCHAEDGSTVDYADIEAALLGSESTSLATALTLTLDAPVDLLNPADLVPACHSASLEGCGLEQGILRRAELKLRRLTIHLAVRDSEQPARVEPRHVDLTIELLDDAHGTLSHALDFTAERHGERFFDLDMSLTLSAAIFDSVDWTDAEIDARAMAHALSHATFEAGERGDEHAHDHDHEHAHDHGHAEGESTRDHADEEEAHEH